MIATMPCTRPPFPSGHPFAYLHLSLVDSLGVSHPKDVLAADVPDGATSIDATFAGIPSGPFTITAQAYATGSFALGSTASGSGDIPVAPDSTFPQVVSFSFSF